MTWIHIPGQPSGPSEADIEKRKRKMAAQAKLGTKRASLSATYEKELEKKYRDSGAHLPPPCPDCVTDNDIPGAHHAKGYCHKHYWKRYRDNGSVPPSDVRHPW